MKSAFLGVVEQLNDFTHYLQLSLNIYIIIFLYAVIYYAFVLFVGNFIKKELIKRKDIIQDTHLYKVTHQKEDIEEDNTLNNTMKTILHKKEDYSEEYHQGLRSIIDAYKPHPYIMMFLLFVQYFVLITLIFFLSTSIELDYIPYLLPIATIFFALNFIQRKKLILRLLITILVIVVYTRFSMGALLFFTYTGLFMSIYKLIDILRKK